MTENIDRLYELLPAFYRKKDAEKGYILKDFEYAEKSHQEGRVDNENGPLRAFLRIISEQVKVLEDDIDQLYDNWFIETCQDWVVPYIGDLIGYSQVHDVRDLTEINYSPDQKYKKILVPRREVANSIRYRRQKGILALLDVLAKDITGWPSYAVELRRSLAFIQNINHLQMALANTVDLEKIEALNRLNSPFNSIAHTTALKAFSEDNMPGYNIPGVGIFVWRLKDYPVTTTQACQIKSAGAKCFTFSALGNDTPLYTHPDENNPVNELRYPMPIKRRALRTFKKDYYGTGKSIQIWVDDNQIELDKIVAADLSNWACACDNGHVAVDPELGRIAFPAEIDIGEVNVSYYYASCSEIGGGEYERQLSQPEDCRLYEVGQGKFECIHDALLQWQKDKETEKAKLADIEIRLKAGNEEKVKGDIEKRLKAERNDIEKTLNKLKNAIIEIVESGIYNEAIRISLDKNENLQIRAANRIRPILRLIDKETKDTHRLDATGSEESSFTLDGLLIASNGIRIEGGLSRVTIRHSTLMQISGKRPNDIGKHEFSSLQLFDTRAEIYVNRSILGPIEVFHDSVLADPILLNISNSVLDSTDVEKNAIRSKDSVLANIQMTVSRCTIIGAIKVHAIKLAEDSIFYGKVIVARRQQGCMRFCYVLPSSRTPRLYKCQPNLAIVSAENELRIRAKKQNIKVIGEELVMIKRLIEEEVVPRFTSKRFGNPAYCQLSTDCASEIKQGAEDESEMGVFHDLYQPQRESILRIRLDEYTPAEVETKMVFMS
jgi:hypothetical protein